VVSFAGELLKSCEELLRNGLHTSEIVSGYQRAYEKTLQILPTLVVKSVKDIRDAKELSSAIKSVLATKQFGYEDVLSDIVSEAAIVTYPASGNNPKLNLDSVRIAKIRGGSVNQTTVIKGMVVLRDTEGIVKQMKNAKIIVFGCGFEASATEAKGTILIRNADELLNYNKSEEKKIEEIVASIAATGVNTVVVNGSISEMSQHFLDKYNILVVKIASKFDLRRICQTLGATATVRLGPATPEEIGSCSLIEVREVGGRKVIVFSQDLNEDTAIATILLRASTENVLNDVERAIDDGVHAIKALGEDPRLLPGAGAVELELSRQLKAYADEVLGLDQYAIRKFAESFEVVPRTLAENSGCVPTSMMHSLTLSHNPETNADAVAAGSNPANFGFDVENLKPFDVTTAGIYDIYTTKVNALRLAVDAAITILRIDQIVMSKPAGGPKPPKTSNDPDN
jgi:T-complex protein 1 subunit theta